MAHLPKHYADIALDAFYYMLAGGASDRDSYNGDRYCKHGQNVGNPYGADLMCGYCEDGISDYDYAIGIAYREMRHDRRNHGRALQLAFYEKMKELEIPKGCFTTGELGDVSMALFSLHAGR